MHRFNDLLSMPVTGATAGECLAHSVPLAGTPGQAYVERRGIPVEVAAALGVLFQANFAGRPAVLAALRDDEDRLVSVHARYLQTLRGQDKMLTIGAGGGVIDLLGGWRAEPLIIVEGLFDALSLAACGRASIATIGRWAPWLVQRSRGRRVWLGFDRSRPGEKDVAQYQKLLCDAEVQRLPPPGRCKDWNTALRKCGRAALTRWIDDCTAKTGREPTR